MCWEAEPQTHLTKAFRIMPYICVLPMCIFPHILDVDLTNRRDTETEEEEKCQQDDRLERVVRGRYEQSTVTSIRKMS